MAVAMVPRTCKQCGKLFEAKKTDVRRGFCVFCSKSCAATYRNLRDNPAKREDVRARKSEAMKGVPKSHGMARSRLYQCWSDMRQRCENAKCKAFSSYGARGIKVCDEWRAFEPFMAWAKANGYRDDLTLDREDNNGDYCPENCRWVTMKVQGNNRRSNRRIDGFTITELAEKHGISFAALRGRLNAGWPIDEATGVKRHKITAYTKRKRNEKGQFT